MKKKIFYSNKIEEIIYVDLQVDELQMFWFFLPTFPQVLFCLINITSKLEYCWGIESPKFWLCSSAVNYFELFLNKAAATEIIST